MNFPYISKINIPSNGLGINNEPIMDNKEYRGKKRDYYGRVLNEDEEPKTRSPSPAPSSSSSTEDVEKMEIDYPNDDNKVDYKNLNNNIINPDDPNKNLDNNIINTNHPNKNLDNNTINPDHPNKKVKSWEEDYRIANINKDSWIIPDPLEKQPSLDTKEQEHFKDYLILDHYDYDFGSIHLDKTGLSYSVLYNEIAARIEMKEEFDKLAACH